MTLAVQLRCRSKLEGTCNTTKIFPECRIAFLRCCIFVVENNLFELGNCNYAVKYGSHVHQLEQVGLLYRRKRTSSREEIFAQNACCNCVDLKYSSMMVESLKGCFLVLSNHAFLFLLDDDVVVLKNK